MKKIYSNLNKRAFWLCLSVSILLISASMIIPPAGVISPSVLTAVGELFAFATLGTVAAAIERGSDITLRKGDMEVQVDNPDQEQ